MGPILSALWRALSDGDIQVISTDHCPFTKEEKASGMHDYSQIPGGVPSIEMRFPALYSSGVAAGRITLNQWVETCCTAPARIAGFNHKGRIEVGCDADLVVFDPDQEVLLSIETLHEDVDWTPYDGIPVQGWPKITFSRGEMIVRDGEFLGAPGRGKYIHRVIGS